MNNKDAVNILIKSIKEDLAKTKFYSRANTINTRFIRVLNLLNLREDIIDVIEQTGTWYNGSSTKILASYFSILSVMDASKGRYELANEMIKKAKKVYSEITFDHNQTTNVPFLINKMIKGESYVESFAKLQDENSYEVMDSLLDARLLQGIYDFYEIEKKRKKIYPIPSSDSLFTSLLHFKGKLRVDPFLFMDPTTAEGQNSLIDIWVILEDMDSILSHLDNKEIVRHGNFLHELAKRSFAWNKPQLIENVLRKWFNDGAKDADDYLLALCDNIGIEINSKIEPDFLACRSLNGEIQFVSDHLNSLVESSSPAKTISSQVERHLISIYQAHNHSVKDLDWLLDLVDSWISNGVKTYNPNYEPGYNNLIRAYCTKGEQREAALNDSIADILLTKGKLKRNRLMTLVEQAVKLNCPTQGYLAFSKLGKASRHGNLGYKVAKTFLQNGDLGNSLKTLKKIGGELERAHASVEILMLME